MIILKSNLTSSLVKKKLNQASIVSSVIGCDVLHGSLYYILIFNERSRGSDPVIAILAISFDYLSSNPAGY